MTKTVAVLVCLTLLLSVFAGCDSTHGRGSISSTDNRPVGTRTVGDFEDLLGYSGVIEETETVPLPSPIWSCRRYRAIDTDGSAVIIAESYGYEMDDTAVDLDGDGVRELICNCTAGGDGHQDAFVYRRNPASGQIECGVFDATKADLSDWSDWGVNSLSTYYEKTDNALVVTYDNTPTTTGFGNGDRSFKEIKFVGATIYTVLKFDLFPGDCR